MGLQYIFLFRGSFGIWSLEIPYAYAQSSFNEDFFEFGKKIYEASETIRYCQKGFFLNFSLFYNISFSKNIKVFFSRSFGQFLVNKTLDPDPH